MVNHEASIPDMQEVYLGKEFRDLVLETANRQYLPHQFSSEAEPLFQDQGGVMVAQSEKLRTLLMTTLDSGRLIVFNSNNGGLDKVVLGVQKSNEGTKVVRIPRFPQRSLGSDSEVKPSINSTERELLLRNPTILFSATPEDQVVFSISEQDNTTSVLDDKRCVMIKGHISPRAGQSFEIIAADISEETIVEGPRHNTIVSHLRSEKKDVSKHHGVDVVKKYEFIFEKISTDIAYDSDLIMHLTTVRNHSLLAASGMTIREGSSYLSPSSWFISTGGSSKVEQV